MGLRRLKNKSWRRGCMCPVVMGYPTKIRIQYCVAIGKDGANKQQLQTKISQPKDTEKERI